MGLVCVILFVAVMSIWFFTIEYPVVFGLYVPAYALRRYVFLALVAVCLVLPMLLYDGSAVAETVSTILGGDMIGSARLIAALLATLISLSLLKLFSVRASAVYAFIGSLLAMSAVDGKAYDNVMVLLLTALAAPLLSLSISFLITLLLKNTIVRSRIHLIRLAHYMRYAVIAALVLTSVAIGLNWGGLITEISCRVSSSGHTLYMAVGVVVLAMAVASPFMNVEDESGPYYDFSIYSVLSVGFAVAFTLFFFSFAKTTSLIGLVPMPLSAGSLAVAAIAGSSLAQRSHLVEPDHYVKEGVSTIAAPVMSFMFTYMILSLMGKGEDSPFMDFAVMSAAVIILSLMLFAAYMRYQKQQKDATERLVRSQQQQIYENSRALNDMELKVILSENQALHNSVEMKRQEVMNVALSMVEQREYLESLNEIVKKISKADDEKVRERLISELKSSLKQRLSYDRDVDSQYFYSQAESLHEDFNAKLAENFPNLTQQEIRLSTLLRLGFSSKYIATLLNITPKSVEISRYRLRQKLGLGRGDNLVNFIKSI